MPIPPQFVKKGAKGKGKKPAHKGAPPKDSKDPKGAPFDAIPSGPMKGQNPFQMNAKRKLLLQQAAKGGK